MNRYASSFNQIPLFSVDEVFGGWTKAQKVHFDDGGIFDQILLKKLCPSCAKIY